MTSLTGAWATVPHHKRTKEGRLLAIVQRARERCYRHRRAIQSLRAQVQRNDAVLDGWREKGRRATREIDNLKQKLAYRDAAIQALREQLADARADALVGAR